MSGKGQVSMAEKLNRLFATTYPPGRGPYTLREVANLITEQEARKHDSGGPSAPVTISFSYLSQLRTGAKDNPSFRQLAALAELFEVRITYFTGTGPEVDQIDAELAVLAAYAGQPPAGACPARSTTDPRRAAHPGRSP